jgi:predicted DNA binding CopG/RHH family protein
MKKRYNVWLDVDLIQRIRDAATKIGVKISTFIRMAILEKLDRHE